MKRVILILLVPDHERVDWRQGERQFEYREREGFRIPHCETSRTGEQVVGAAEYLSGREEVSNSDSDLAMFFLRLEILIHRREHSRRHLDLQVPSGQIIAATLFGREVSVVLGADANKPVGEDRPLAKASREIAKIGGHGNIQVARFQV